MRFTRASGWNGSRTAWIAMLTLLAAVAAQAAGPSPAYLHAVERYRSGDRSVVREMGSAERVREEIAGLKRLQRTAATCRECGARARFESFPFEAAVMLHTDRDVHERESLDEREEVPPGPAPHLQAARQILELIPDPERRRRVERPWFLAAVLHLYRRGQWPMALRYLEEALQLYPEDPRLLLALGSLLEAQAALDQRLVVRVETTPSRRDAALRQVAETRRRLAEAEACYRRALRAEPTLLAARVRIGRVLHREGQPGNAASELEAVVATADADPRLLYLAWLFLGAAREAEGRPQDAVPAYRAAIVLEPKSQPAHLALSHALHRLGDRAASVETLRAAVALAAARTEWDPWWQYRWGQSHEADDRLDALRAEAMH